MKESLETKINFQLMEPFLERRNIFFTNFNYTAQPNQILAMI